MLLQYEALTFNRNISFSNTKCLFYKPTDNPNKCSNYVSSFDACLDLHPNAEPAEAKTEKEFQALLSLRKENSRWNYWLGRGAEVIKDETGSHRTFKSGVLVNETWFKSVRMMENTERVDLSGRGCLRLGDTLGKRDYIQVVNCESNTKNSMTMCELRL